MSAPFRYSGERHYVEREEDRYLAFKKATGISLLPSCGIDTTEWIGDWRGVAPKTEIVLAEFTAPITAPEQDQAEPQLELFGKAAA